MKKLSLSLLLIAVLFYGCHTEDMVALQIVTTDEGLMVLGEKMEDPYALANMQKAYNNLVASNPDMKLLTIEPTHQYLRFLPQSDAEWSQLKSDTFIVLYDYPLNYEIVNPGTYYHDPLLPDTAVTYQYCVLPIGYAIPDIQYELLYEVYIPADDEEDDNPEGSRNDPAVAKLLLDLEHESVRLTGNLPTPEFGMAGLLPDKWTPKGTVTVKDDLMGMQIPVEGAEVHARWFTHVETDITDALGYFSTAKFRYEINYAVKWERGLYDIRNGYLLQAWYNGPKKKGDWNLNITGGESMRYAHIHRAAYKYFYTSILGLLPPVTAFRKLKISYLHEEGGGMYWGQWGQGAMPDIRIWGLDEYGTDKETQYIFGTTLHELAHQAHYVCMGSVLFLQVSDIVAESWADAVEWVLANDEYRKLGVRYLDNGALTYFHDGNNHETWPQFANWDYSPVFIDLMDNVNQRTKCAQCPNDLVSGYTPSNLNVLILPNAFGLSSLRDELKKQKPAGVTDTHIDELFALYW